MVLPYIAHKRTGSNYGVASGPVVSLETGH